MTTEIQHPLLDIVNRALKSKATGPAAKLQERFQNAGSDVIALCDVSGSMWDFVGSTGTSKFDHLVAALKDVVKGFPKLVIVAFSSRAAKATVQDLEEEQLAKRGQMAGRYTVAPFDHLGGGTAMGFALEFVAHNWNPRKTILITDGQPDNENHALAAVELLTGAVDTIYCGPDADPAVDFLRRLSRAGAGTHVTWDSALELAPILRRLALPAPKGAIQL
jgi:uncharacterized protein with von Willebrand factor type A (vWA) domain